MNNALPVGLGGGGTMFAPQISPHDSNLIFIACDMTGLYRSTDAGVSWLMCDGRQVQSFGTDRTGLESPYGFSVVFHPDPNKSQRVVAFHPKTGLMVSDQRGDDDTWIQFQPTLPLNGDGFPLRVVAAGFSRDFTTTVDSNLLIGTHDDSVGTFGLYHIESNAWKTSTYVGGAAINTRVIAFCFFRSAVSSLYFCATVNDVMQSTDQGRTWSSIKSAGAGLPAGFTICAICSNSDTIFVTVATPAGTQGVYSYQVTATVPVWTAMNNGLSLGAGFEYWFIATADDRDTPHSGTTNLFVTAITPGLSPPNVFRSTNGGMWQGVYAGVHAAGVPPPNVTPGWVDEAEQPTRRGWGFGGPAWGFVVAPSNSDILVFTNQAVCDICENGTSASLQWDNRYTQLTSPAGSQLTPAERWRSTGLDVTTVWKYFIHPTQTNIHFICYTDIGLARSDDGGQTWATISIPDGSGGLWGNFYDLISDAAGATLWAAVSGQHDIPHEKELNETNTPIGTGGVVTSTDNGLSWSPYGGAGLPNQPVISLVLANGVLYASIWGTGIFKSIPPAGAWTQVGSLTTGGTHPHCCRIDFADAAKTDLYCVVAADTTGGGFIPGGLFHLPNAPTASATTAWLKLSASLETLIQGLTPPGLNQWRLVPIDFAIAPFPTEPGVHYLCTADAGGHGGGGIYKFNSATNAWSVLGAATAPFATAYNDGLEVFAVFYFNGIRYATSGTHGTWFSADNGANWQEYKAGNFIRTQRILFPTIDQASGLVKGDASSAPFFLSTFGGSALQVPRQLFLILETATVVKSSVVPNSPIAHAFYVVFENFLPAETGAGIQSSSGGLSYNQAPQVTFIDPATGAAVPGIQVNQPSLSMDDVTLLTDTPQRFIFEYQLTFTSTGMFAAAGSRAITVQAKLAPYACSAILELVTDYVASPQMDNGSTSWLSDALRVFHVAEGTAGYTGGPTLTFNSGDTPQAAALRFLTNVLTDFNTNPAHFMNVSTAEDSAQSKLFLHQSVGNVRQYNFAVARVQANASATATANNVQLFFRLFTTAVSYTSYDPLHSYRRVQQPGSTVETPLLGVEPPVAPGSTDVRIATIPCFGSARIDYSVLSTAVQTDPSNMQNVPQGGTVFFGCWLDFNQPDPRYPLHPTDDGPYPAGSLKSIQELIRGNHQCLVAEIFAPQGDPIPTSTLPPAGLGSLAQRNLSIDEVSNPGQSGDGRTVAHTFEIGAMEWNREGAVPELLMIDWGTLPPGSRARLFLPEVDALQSVRRSSRYSGSTGLHVLDSHTLACAVGGRSFIPILTTERRRTPALITVELPSGVTAGEVFRFMVRQVSGAPRHARVTGMFQFSIPVKKTRMLLRGEERKLGVLRWIAKSVSNQDVWNPALTRYLQVIARRVSAFGGNPDAVPPSPYGAPMDGPRGCLPAWFSGILKLLGLGGGN